MFPQDESLAALIGLMAWSCAGGVASVILLFLLAARATGKAWAGALTAAGFFSGSCLADNVTAFTIAV